VNRVETFFVWGGGNMDKLFPSKGPKKDLRVSKGGGVLAFFLSINCTQVINVGCFFFFYLLGERGGVNFGLGGGVVFL